MDRLPPELLDFIVGYCNYSSLKALRSVNQSFNEVATAGVFEQVFIAPCTFLETLENLNALIQSPQKLAQHIKKLTFYADILPPWDRHEWEAKASKKPNVDAKRLDDSWPKYQTLCNKQSEWFFGNDQYVLAFKELLSSLPKLREATVGIAEPFQGSTSRWPVWSRLKTHILVSPEDSIFDEEADYRWNENRMAQTTRATLNLLEAIGFRASFAGTSHVQTLSVRSMNNGRLKSLLAGRTQDGTGLDIPPNILTRFQTLLGAFANLTSLDLQIPQPVRETSRVLPHSEQIFLLQLTGLEVCAILATAPKLKRLRFEFDSESGVFWEPGQENIHPLSCFFQDHEDPWPALEDLTLSVNMPYTLLLSFLSRLAGTLRRLDLRDMCVYDAQALFACLANVVRLEDIHIECLWTKINMEFANVNAPPTTCILCEGLDADEPYEKQLKAYLLGRSDQFPKLTGNEFLSDEELDDLAAGMG